MQDLEETAEIKVGVRLTQRNINDLIKVFCGKRFAKNNDRMVTHYIDMTQKMYVTTLQLKFTSSLLSDWLTLIQTEIRGVEGISRLLD